MQRAAGAGRSNATRKKAELCSFAWRCAFRRATFRRGTARSSRPSPRTHACALAHGQLPRSTIVRGTAVAAASASEPSSASTRSTQRLVQCASSGSHVRGRYSVECIAGRCGGLGLHARAARSRRAARQAVQRKHAAGERQAAYDVRQPSQEPQCHKRNPFPAVRVRPAGAVTCRCVARREPVRAFLCCATSIAPADRLARRATCRPFAVRAGVAAGSLTNATMETVARVKQNIEAVVDAARKAGDEQLAVVQRVRAHPA